ncbi:dipeptide ABC transporter ATP-binding protein [Nocardia goodfellowii]|uniref:Peptide/nickel transport system ATP-binding protein n=1 Tax=Nocardia goodfellowii TaxID=882446 RepID=A0ABS4QBT2_9NOCA|nr:ABC transporter ATP-binding protein [Nocardia goodfellowii]MBP2189164.1 peptide/nickel transport system ATP-binding protein [Nocardia goodfellowii]
MNERSPVAVTNLRIGFPGAAGIRDVVKGIDLRIDPGEAVALVGESGSGKSVTARALVGLAGAGAVVRADRLELSGQDARGYRERQWRRIRGSDIGFVLQDALVSLDPLCTVGAQLAAAQRALTGLRGRARTERSVRLLTDVGVPEPERRLRQYPYELSGGLRQRVLIATAIAGDPRLIIADEPTTALDVTVQQQILELLRQRKAAGNALLLISHDLAVVAELADRVLVMKDGEVVESGATRAVLTRPEHPYTKRLLAAVPSAASRGTRLAIAEDSATEFHERRPLPPRTVHNTRIVLSVQGLRKTYGSRPDARTVVDGVDFDLFAGETLGIVGESGSGKTTTARLALRLLTPSSGRIVVDGQPWSEYSERELRPHRSTAQLIAQDPLSSFDPRYTVARIIGESLDTVGLRGRARADRVRDILDAVRLGRDFLDRHPRTLSGGQRQRVAIARALAPNPALIVADEPVSALDVSVQAQILDLLAELQAEFGTALLLISHDLGVVRHIADRVVVMKDGQVVESGAVDSVLVAPQHDYTRRLVASVPRLPELSRPS